MKFFIKTMIIALFGGIFGGKVGAQDAHSDVHKLALRYNDVQVAITSLYYQLAKDTNNIVLKDSLAGLYFVGGAYVQSLLLGNEVLAKQPENRKMLELTAISEQGLGRLKESLEAYDKLYKLTRSVYHLYQIGVLQFNLQRFGECGASVSSLLADAASEKEKIVITVSNQQRQEVPLRAAALNVRGVMFRETKNLEMAKQAFEESLKLFPDFALPKGNLEDMKKPKPVVPPK